MKKIVLVDDEKIVLEMIGEMLEEKGYSVSMYQESTEFIRQCRQNGCDADLLILDYNMPGMDGIEVLGQLYELNILEFLPVILLSGILEEKLDFDPMEDGRVLALEYRKKPIKLSWLAETVFNLSRLGLYYRMHGSISDGSQ